MISNLRLSLLLLSAAASLAGSPLPAVSILEKRCLGCHAGTFKKSGLDVSTRDLLLRGGDRGPAIVPGEPESSLLYQVVARTKPPHMPFKGSPIPAAEVRQIAAWIKAGAPFENNLKVPQVSESSIETSTHWSFQPPQRPAVPPAPGATWARNPVDAFLASEHRKRNLTVLPEADRRTLLRRLYLDVVGLPPTPQEVKAFLGDQAPQAYERMVDRLLADPRYGERWGRHWMDVWRYSDWYGWRRGNDVRNSHKFVWRWRDWIVESLNQDKPYDRMVTEMLAGDEIAPRDPSTLRATGFLVRNFSRYDRNGWLQDAVDHTAMGMLGVTLKCARCHDHKYDPIPQQDYYRFRAFFEPHEVRIDRVPGQPDTDKDGLSRVFDAEPDRPTYLLIRGDIQNPDKSQALAPGTPQILGGQLPPVKPASLPVSAYYPDFRSFVHDDLRTQAKADIERAEAELRKAQEEHAKAEADAATAGAKAVFSKLREAADQLDLAEKKLAAARAYAPALDARIAADKAKYSDPPDTAYEELAATARKLEREAGILKAGEALLRAQLEFQKALAARKPGNVADEKKVAEAQKSLAAAQAALTQNAEGYSPLGKIYPDHTSGRRTALAAWIANKQNPLTARVAVNHIWLRHFGKPLVPTVFDFGKNGRSPTHPELLDWLAVEFMDSGWSMKALHRLILTSGAYRMQSAAGPQGHPSAKIDPENTYLWRMNPRRMEAEIVRDSVLSVAGQLDQTMGGPEIEDTQGLKTHRRSLYFAHSPDVQVEFLKIFDSASPAECYERTESVIPQQALALANSQISREPSRVLARRLATELGPAHTPAAFAKAAFETVLGRAPSAGELAAAERFLGQQPAIYQQPAKLTFLGKPDSANPSTVADPVLRARENLVHVLFNHNDFVTIR